MHTVISGSRKVGLYQANGILVRKWILNKDVVGTYASGDTVTINCAGGYTYIYKSKGQLVGVIRQR